MLPKLFRPLLLAAIATAGLLLVARAIAGPLTWPVSVNSPLNAAGVCALAVVLALALRHEPCAPEPAAWPRWPVAAGLLVLVAAAYARVLGFYFFSDDFIVVELGRNFRFDPVHLLTTGGGDGFFRPMGYVSLGLTGAIAGSNPAWWHAATLAIHLVNCVLVLLLAARLVPSRAAAAFAAALFAVHGTRPEVAVWIAGRFDLIATFFVLAGLVLFLRGGALARSAALISMALGILSKESAYAFPLLLVVLVWAAGERKRRAYVALAPYFAVAGALFAYRWVLFGGMGGYPASFAVLPALKALFLRVWAALFFPLNWSLRPGLFLGVLLAAYVGALLVIALGRTRFDAIPAIAFALLACIPPLTQLLIAADLQKSRMLYLPSVGFCLLLALAVDRLAVRPRRHAAAIILLFHFAALEHNLNVWSWVSPKVERACAAAARCGPPIEQPAGLPGDLHGVPFFANGFRNGAEMKRPAAVKSGTLRWDSMREEVVCEPKN